MTEYIVILESGKLHYVILFDTETKKTYMPNGQEIIVFNNTLVQRIMHVNVFSSDLTGVYRVSEGKNPKHGLTGEVGVIVKTPNTKERTVKYNGRKNAVKGVGWQFLRHFKTVGNPMPFNDFLETFKNSTETTDVQEKLFTTTDAEHGRIGKNAIRTRKRKSKIAIASQLIGNKLRSYGRKQSARSTQITESA
jgi:hypothetical protein